MTGPENASVAMAVCTCNRVEGLRRLFDALDHLRLGALNEDRVRLLIVDNSVDGSMRSRCADSVPKRFPAEWIHEPLGGLSFARNAALTAARRNGVDFLAFIDDDEMPGPDWLAELVVTLCVSGAAAAVGPVLPVFAVSPPRWAAESGLFAKFPPVEEGKLHDGYTANAIVRIEPLAGLTFDPRFNLLGGEDTYFFQALRRRGLEIVWAERAFVHEDIPVSRLSVPWLVRRWYRTGAVEGYLGRLAPASLAGRVVNLGRGLLRLAAGSLRVAVAFLWPLRRPGELVASLYTLARGAGLTALAFGVSYREYSSKTYR
jgi:glycosyltransferase involved in cell wall biosynthesis